MAQAVNTVGDQQPKTSQRRLRSFFGQSSLGHDGADAEVKDEEERPTKWSMGVLNDRITHEVPGSVLLLTGHRNEPLGLRNAPARTSSSSLPAYPTMASRRQSQAAENKKKTPDGAIILEPQPDDSHNDPLNWAAWRRDSALLSLGFYCMIGGGMTPILAAGFTNVADTYHVTVPEVALTTGLYMMGLGLGSVFASPTAILYGKRPVYLASAILFIATSLWCAASPSYVSLVIARILQGVSVSPVECLPSATIAEIFFLHERAYRIGIYTLLLLGGKNLIPLVSAVIIQALGWPWVFWVVAIVVGFCWVLLFLFVPETFWDRTPRPKSRRPSHGGSTGFFGSRKPSSANAFNLTANDSAKAGGAGIHNLSTIKSQNELPNKILSTRHVGFASKEAVNGLDGTAESEKAVENAPANESSPPCPRHRKDLNGSPIGPICIPARHKFEDRIRPAGLAPPTPALHNFNSPYYNSIESTDNSFPWSERTVAATQADGGQSPPLASPNLESNSPTDFRYDDTRSSALKRYTTNLKQAPRQSFVQQLRPWNGRLHNDNWLRVAIRPFILFAYPAVLWSAIVYACSVGWLIVLSESVAAVYRSRSTYNFSALSTGLIYLSPFIGGILGTAVAGKVSDIIVRAMSRRNGGLYEPEFRLVMAIPIAITTVIGLMGFGWSAEIHDPWIVPTVFFGIISFGCSLGSTTAITFCVDSYRAYAGEALVTLNFSKNVLHGLVFSLFFNHWLEAQGSKKVFVALGSIQLALMVLTVPMYVFGKRARMWTVRKNFMEKF